jgi:2,4-dienoyl-CoA reductase-like NADH-dependent reductase (Old Yellow Enzyme family)
MVHYRAEPGNSCGAFHLVHLGRYALGGFGLVFVEATAVEEIGLINEHDLGIWNEAQVESFRPLIAFMKRQNTAIGIQLAHGGRKASSQTAMQGMGPLTEDNIKSGAKVWQPVGPTAEPVAKGWLTPRQLTTAECKAMVGTWARGQERGQGRLRHYRNPRRARLPARLVPVACFQHAQRRIWRRPRRAHAPAARYRRGRAQGNAC